MNYMDIDLICVHVCFCRTLQLEYLDLILIHWPITTNPGEVKYPIEVSDIVEFDLKGVWTSLEECQKLGLTKAIGASNFSIKKLQKLLSFATIPPAVNQVINNYYHKLKLILPFHLN